MRLIGFLWILLRLTFTLQDGYEPKNRPFSTDCQAVLSEVKTYSQTATSVPFEFVKLEQVCGRKPKVWRESGLQNFRLLTILSDPPSIVANCKLVGGWNLPKKSDTFNPFYVIGPRSTTVTTALLEEKCDAAKIDLRKVDKPMALVLIFSRSGHHLINLRLANNGEYKPMPVDSFNRHMIATNLQDMMLFASTTPEKLPKVFTDIQQHFQPDTNPAEVFVTLTQEARERGISIIRCSETKYGMEPHSLYISKESTPTGSNKCTDAESVFQVGNAGFSTQVFQTEDRVTAVEAEREHVIASEHVIATEHITRNHPNAFLTETLSTAVLQWLEFLHDSEGRVERDSYRCKICNHVISKGIVAERGTSAGFDRLMYPEGLLIDNPTGDQRLSVKARNKKLIEVHARSEIHKVAEFYFQSKSKYPDANELTAALLKPGSVFRNYYSSTEDLVRVCHAAVRMRVSFESFTILTELIARFGVQFNHFSNREGITKMVKHLGDLSHKQLIEYLKGDTGKDLVISFQADTSSDLTKESHLSIILQWCDTSLRVFTALYGFILVETDESGSELFNLLVKRFEQDGIKDYMKTHLYGVTTDGAPAMYNTFFDAAKDFSPNPIIRTHCTSHRIQLAVKRAYLKHPYLQHIDNTINRVYRFYHVSAICSSHLRQMTIDEGDTSFHLQKIFKIRWITSKYSSSKTVLRHLKTIVKDLKAILSEQDAKRTMKPERVQELRDLIEELTDRSFVIHLAFLADVQSIVSQLSLDSQYACQTHIGESTKRQEVQKQVEKLSDDSNCKHLKAFLEHTTCDGIPCTIQTYETAEVVSHKTINLGYTSKSSPVSPKLSLVRSEYIRDIVSKLEEAFPEQLYQDFDIFYPANLATYLNTPDSDLVKPWLRLNRWFWFIQPVNLDTAYVLVREYKEMLRTILLHEYYSRYKQFAAHDFWEKFATAPGIYFGVHMKKFLQHLLAVPMSSAGCERSFSLYNLNKVKHRASLSAATAEALVRIRENISDKPSDEEIIYYAREWSRTHLRPHEKSKTTLQPSVGTANVGVESVQETTVHNKLPVKPKILTLEMI